MSINQTKVRTTLQFFKTLLIIFASSYFSMGPFFFSGQFWLSLDWSLLSICACEKSTSVHLWLMTQTRNLLRRSVILLHDLTLFCPKKRWCSLSGCKHEHEFKSMATSGYNSLLITFSWTFMCLSFELKLNFVSNFYSDLIVLVILYLKHNSWILWCTRAFCITSDTDTLCATCPICVEYFTRASDKFEKYQILDGCTSCAKVTCGIRGRAILQLDDYLHHEFVFDKN